MKIYNESENASKVGGKAERYKCNNCEKVTVFEGELPSNWLKAGGYDEHYCPRCQRICSICKKSFSEKYAKSWFTFGRCFGCLEVCK